MLWAMGFSLSASSILAVGVGIEPAKQTRSNLRPHLPLFALELGVLQPAVLAQAAVAGKLAAAVLAWAKEWRCELK